MDQCNRVAIDQLLLHSEWNEESKATCMASKYTLHDYINCAEVISHGFGTDWPEQRGLQDLHSINHCQVPFLTDGKLEVQVSCGSGYADFHENYHVCK